jgi:tRNA-dihydrouridine synthase B
MRLGPLHIKNALILAPMAGITDAPFRRLAKEFGCGLVFTEMISADGLLRNGEMLLGIGEDNPPASVQLFGSTPEVLAEAAGMAEAMGAHAIDINMGCPARQVVKREAGAALMQFPEKVRRILLKVRGNIRCPLTIKIRSGWDRGKINAVEISKIAEDCGVDGVTLHARTKAQGFGGQADWNLIREVKGRVGIPVIGNGDVTTPILAKRMIEETGCDGVMIGRGALGNPWIFHALAGFQPTLEERLRVIEHHLSLVRNHYGERGAVKEFRKHVAWYTKGLQRSASFRSMLPGMKGEEELREKLGSYFRSIERIDPCQSFVLTENRSVTG